MDFGFTGTQLELRRHLRDLLADPATLTEIAAGAGHTPMNLYREMGRRGWLAPDWPQTYGGLGLTAVESGIVAEELALHGVPDSARINTIDNVGTCILHAGTDEQRRMFLPHMAAGDVIASVLFTEPDCGSDLASLTTRAERMHEGWVLHGTKVWNATSSMAAFGLCAARTGPPASGYLGLTLFLVPMDAHGVEIEQVASMASEPLYRVRLRGAAVDPIQVVGEVGAAWQVIDTALARERGGLTYFGRARRWLDALIDRCRQRDLALPEEVVELDGLVESGRVLAWSAVEPSAGADPTPAARAKWYNSELARRVALAAQRHLGLDATLCDEVLSAAHVEAPGVTLSAGTSEMMLQIIATALPGSTATLA